MHDLSEINRELTRRNRESCDRLYAAFGRIAAEEMAYGRTFAITHACGHTGDVGVSFDDPTFAQAEQVLAAMRRKCPACVATGR